ncbi:MAG: hypothetical protein HS126_07205 [Anaerolineales bacterium]|nr:hypothetical protein [Anaerolineales bacterium]
MITSSSERSIQITANPQDSFLSAIQLWGLVLLTLHLAAAKLPEENTWSLWPYTFLPSWLGWILALLAGTLIISSINQFIQNKLRLTFYALRFTFSHQIWFILISFFSGLLFWLARLRHLRWGDSYLLTQALSTPDLELRVIYNWQAPFTVFLHQRLWQLVADPLLGWPVEAVYATTSILCGVIFVYLLLTWMARLGRTPMESAVLAGLVLTTGSMQLFFGYVENYTIISLGLLVTLFLAWRALRGEIQLIWPVLALSLTNAFHPSTVFLWPGMLLLSWLCWRRRRVSAGGALWQTVLPPLLVGVSVLALMESGGHGLVALLGQDRPGGGDGVWFVPLFEIDPQWQKYQPYTMFSAAHLLDWLNIHLLISPFGLSLLAMILAAVYRFRLTLFDQPADRDYGYFLALTAAMYVLLTWLWNPDYGGRKDWDLFAPSAFVYTLLAGYLLVRVMRDHEKLSQAGLFAIAVSLLHTAAWIFTNTHLLPKE